MLPLASENNFAVVLKTESLYVDLLSFQKFLAIATKTYKNIINVFQNERRDTMCQGAMYYLNNSFWM